MKFPNTDIMEKLKYELEEEKSQKSFYQVKHKEVNTELQTKTSELENAKKRIIALENESLAKQSELKRVKKDLEEKDNDIHGLSYDKDGLRQQLKDITNQMDTLKGKILRDIRSLFVIQRPTLDH